MLYRWGRCVRGAVLGAVVFLATPVTASAAQQVVSASVAGVVRDSSGGVVGAASVRLRHVETGLVSERATDHEGRYRFIAVPVGALEMTVTAPGFATVVVETTVRIGDAVDIPVRLDAAAVRESVDVRAAAVAVDTSRTQQAETITPREIDGLPLNGRNYLDLALLAPNVSRTNTRSNERFAETSAVPGTGISIAGQRNLANTFVVDGLSANDDAADLAGTYFAEEVIREFQVITSGGIAEFGRASSGIVNIATRSGTNEWRGRAYGFGRHSRFEARPALASRKDPASQAQFGLTVGGPLRKDRTFLFANVERLQQHAAGVVTIDRGVASTVSEILRAAGYAAPVMQTGEYRSGYDMTNAFARLDRRRARSHLQGRYSLYDVSGDNARGVGGLNAVSRGTALRNRDQTAAASWQWVGLTAFNEARSQFTRSRLDAPANDPRGPAVSISGIANLGTSTSSPTGRDLDVFQVADTVTVQRGAHLLKAGADFLHNGLTVVFPGALQGVYTFTSIENLQRGAYQQFQQAFGAASLTQSNPNLGAFLQDEWAIAPALTLNAGLRYDLQLLPAPIRLDRNNISPRFGIAWAPGDRRTVLRGSAGIYFDRIPLRATSNALQRDGVHYQVAVLSFGQAGAPAFPDVLPRFPANVVTAITTIDPAIDNGRSEQFAVQLERQVGGGASAALSYARLRGHGIIMQRNTNVPTMSAAEAASRGVANLGRPDGRFANISRYEAVGESWFDGLTVSITAPQVPWGTARLSYTLSRALDTSGNTFFNTPQNNADVAAEKGPSDNDQRHRFVMSGTLGSGLRLGGLQVGYVAAVATGVPFNVVAGSDLNNDTNNNDRPPGVGRNSARQPATATLDVRVSRAFGVGGRRVEAMVEAFNIFNRVNVLAVNNTFGIGATPRAAFGQPTLVGDPRQLQAGVRFEW